MKLPEIAKTFIGLNIPITSVNNLLKKKVTELFKQKGFFIRQDEIIIEEGDYELFLHFPCYLEQGDMHDARMEEMYKAAEAIGFSEIASENTNVMLSLIFDALNDHSLDHRSNTVVLEFYNESDFIMNEINRLFEDIDGLTADEAKKRLSMMYTSFKKQYGWGK